MILPRWLVDDVAHQKLLDDMGTTVAEQLSLARFIDTGGFTRHLRRVRPIYRRRRNAMLEAIATSLPQAAPKGIAAGLHAYVELPDWCDEARLVDAALEQDLLIEGARWHWSAQQATPPALLLGYGATTEAAIRIAHHNTWIDIPKTTPAQKHSRQTTRWPNEPSRTTPGIEVRCTASRVSAASVAKNEYRVFGIRALSQHVVRPSTDRPWDQTAA